MAIEGCSTSHVDGMLKQQKCDNVKQIEIIIDDEFSGDVMCFDLCFTTFRLILPPPSLGLIGPRKVLYDPQTQFAIPSSTAAPNITPISGQFRTVPAAARCCRFQHVQTQTNVSHSACVLHRRSGFDGLQAAYGNIPISGTGNCLNYCEIFIIHTQFTNVPAGRIIHPGAPRVGDPFIRPYSKSIPVPNFTHRNFFI